MTRSAVLIVDLQYDFLPGGALAVPEGDLTLAPIYKLLDEAQFDLVIASQDHHPPKHVSFASRWEMQPFTKFRAPDFGKGEKDIDLWPDHCVQKTHGCELEKNLEDRLDRVGAIVVKKGEDHNEDAYSAFSTRAEPPYSHHSLVAKILRDAQISDLFVLGLATDYCVKATARAALEASTAASPWTVYVIRECCRGVDAQQSKDTLAQLEHEGAKVISIDGEELKQYWRK